jgi:hypothetical protein
MEKDPDPHLFWSAGSGSWWANMAHEERKKDKIPYSDVLDFLLSGLEASPVAWTSFMGPFSIIFGLLIQGPRSAMT